MFERFTNQARSAVVLAQEAAATRNDSFIGTEHILLGLIHEGEGAAGEALRSLGIGLEAVRLRVEEAMGQAGQVPSENARFSPGARRVFEFAEQEALRLDSGNVSTGHILLGILRHGESVAAQVLTELGADLDQARQQLLRRSRESSSSGEALTPEYLLLLENDLLDVIVYGLRNDEMSVLDAKKVASDFLDMLDLGRNPEQVADGLAQLGMKHPQIEPLRKRYLERMPLLSAVLEIQDEKRAAIAQLYFDDALRARKREKELLRRVRDLSPFQKE